MERKEESSGPKMPHPIEFGPPLEQPSFFKSISELEFGDRIWVTSAESVVPFADDRKSATVLGLKHPRTFQYQATLLLDGASDVSSTRELDLLHKFELASLEGQDTVWVATKYIRPGHILSWWGSDATVEATEHQGNLYILTVTDPENEERVKFTYKETDELSLKIAEPTEEKKARRERLIANRMLPPLAPRLNESPEDFAQRVMRQIEEWSDE